MDEFDLGSCEMFGKKGITLIDSVSIDSRTIFSDHALFVALPGKHGHGHLHVEEALKAGALFAIVEDAWEAPASVKEEKLIRVPSPLFALQDLARCYRASLTKLDVVAIAGSCGKTMLKDLLSHIFPSEDIYFSPESFNSQIGVALSLLNIPPKSTRLAFIEMAATEKGEMSRLVKMASPKYAVITNFYRRRLGSPEMKERVADELSTLLSSLPSSGKALVEKTSFTLAECRCSIQFWNEKKTHVSYQEELVSIAQQTAEMFHKSEQDISSALATYRPETMRTDIWKNNAGTTFINLPYSKTPLSMAASLEEMNAYTAATKPLFHGKTVLFFGGLRQEKNIRSLSERLSQIISQHKIQKVFCWKKDVFDALEHHKNFPFSLHFSPTLEQAICSAKIGFGPYDTVIFKGEHKFPLDFLMEQLEDSTPNTLVCINLAAILSNLELIRKKLPHNTRIMVMVKALAYGTDDCRISHFLRSCDIDILGVSYVDEGVRLRQNGDSQAIFCLHAAENEMKKAVRWNLEVGIGTSCQLAAVKKAALELNVKAKVHLHVDTGMKRFGCSPEAALVLGREIAASNEVEFEGIFTHFAVSDDPAHDEFTLFQANTLEQVIDALEKEGICPKYRHACNSAGAIRFSFPSFNMARIGLATYGFHTSSATKPLLELRPALSLRSKIVGFSEGKKGDTVSYGRTYSINTPQARFAILPIGYSDGLHRSYSSKARVRICGKQAPVVGRICMDYTMVEVTHIPEAQIGDTALFFGEDEQGMYFSPEELAATGGSITHELMSCLGPRIKRLFIYDESLVTR